MTLKNEQNSLDPEALHTMEWKSFYSLEIQGLDPFSRACQTTTKAWGHRWTLGRN